MDIAFGLALCPEIRSVFIYYLLPFLKFMEDFGILFRDTLAGLLLLLLLLLSRFSHV